MTRRAEWRQVEGLPGYEFTRDGRIRSYWSRSGRMVPEPRPIIGRIRDDGTYLRVRDDSSPSGKRWVNVGGAVARAFGECEHPDWRPVPGYDGRYQVSRDGRIRAVRVRVEGTTDTRPLLDPRELEPRDGPGTDRYRLLDYGVTDHVSGREIARRVWGDGAG